jgi:hypothetical protein
MPEWADEDPTVYSLTVDPAEAAEEVLVEEQARLYTFAGRRVTRDILRTDPRSVRGRVGTLEPVYAEDSTFRCESTRVALDGQTLHVRTGVMEELLLPLEDLPDRTFARRRAQYRQLRNGNRYRLVRGEAGSGEGLDVLTPPDGCMLSVSLE